MLQVKIIILLKWDFIMKADYIFLYKYLLCLDEIQSTPHNITLPKVIFSPLYTHIYVRMQS